jgi:hypothetical protein
MQQEVPMRARMLTLVGVLLLTSACAAGPRPRAAGSHPASAEREVWIAALHAVSGGTTPASYVVSPEAGRGDVLGADTLIGLRRDTLADFVSRPKEGRLPADLDPGAPIVWFGTRDFDALPMDPSGPLVEGRWAAFRTRFPGAPGWTRLSRIGFSSDGLQALLFVENSSAGLSGWGALFLLERGPTGWRVVQRAAGLTA